MDNETQNAIKLDWFPLYFQRLKGSPAWKLKDYQFAWYMKLLIESADSPIPGYLPGSLDKLWKLAGAKSLPYFEKFGGGELVSQLFSRTDISGQIWIYNKRMVQVIYEQSQKLSNKTRKRNVSLSVSLQKVPDFIPADVFHDYVQMRESIKKPLTGNAIKLAYRKLEKLKADGHDAKEVLEQSIFRSWAGLFPIEQVTNGRGTSIHNGGGQNQGVQKQESLNGSRLAETDCPKCGGSGWDSTSGKAARCECWLKNRKANAASASAS